ncbi:MAG: Uncharacterised protein [Methanobacteriota archaeon]|nr:MAG: Uncharacterised protein [Euryarchaeota archaeon]
MLAIISISIGILCLIFITWYFYFKKQNLINKKLINSDESLLTDPGLKIESVFQVPQGSIVYPYIVINEDTTRKL